jgi:hypothetical protein
MHRLAAALVLATLGALAAPAAAAPDPFADFIAGLTDAKAAAAQLGDCELLLLPSGEARTPCKLAITDLGAPAGATLTAKKIKYGHVDRSMLMYVEADVDARAGGKVVATYHVLAVDAGGNPDYGFRPAALQIERPISDKDAAAKAKAKQLPAPAVIEDVTAPATGPDDQGASDRANGLDEVTRWVKAGIGRNEVAAIADGGGVVLGSAPGQKYSGRSAAAQIKKWKLDLAQKGGVTADGGGMLAFAATDVVGTLPDKTTITYAALVIAAAHMIPGSGDMVWEVKMISFEVPQ